MFAGTGEIYFSVVLRGVEYAYGPWGESEGAVGAETAT